MKLISYIINKTVWKDLSGEDRHSDLLSEIVQTISSVILNSVRLHEMERVGFHNLNWKVYFYLEFYRGEKRSRQVI